MMSAWLKGKFLEPPQYIDVVILSLFTILITFHPYYVHGKINIFEVGLYLPGIQSVLNGEVPYRDVFHLRGPLELYLPAFLMKMFGVHINVLYSYFYFGSVLCLILCVLIAKELFKTRTMLYLMVPVLIGRTFPRVVFTYWGGMRYAFGLLALWFVMKFFKRGESKWMVWAGVSTSLGLLTSIEIGVYAFCGVLAALIVSQIFRVQDTKLIVKATAIYLMGILIIGIPYGLYMAIHQAFIPYVESVYTIVTNMQNVIDPHFVSVYPRNFAEAFAAMVNPNHTNFKHMTPSYLYIFILAYLGLRIKRKVLNHTDLMVMCLGIYGFVMYNTGFRGIWAAQFEMALQPEKILLFFLLEIFLLMFLAKKAALREAQLSRHKGLKIFLINLFCFVLIGSSIGYAIQRYNHRFFAFKHVRNTFMGKETASLMPLANVESQALTIERAKGVLVPKEQALELEAVASYVNTHIEPQEAIFTYPELGTYNFLINRRFFGRFPLPTFAWFNDQWQRELMDDLSQKKPKFVILEKDIPQYWKDVYLALEPNRQKHQEVLDYIFSNYHLVYETPKSGIYVLN